MYNKARKLLKKSKKDVKRFKQHLKAGICPTCKENLQLRVEDKSFTTKILFWLYENKYKSYTVKCPNNHKLIHPVYGDRSSLACFEYDNCLNNDIRNQHNISYNDDLY